MKRTVKLVVLLVLLAFIPVFSASAFSLVSWTAFSATQFNLLLQMMRMAQLSRQSIISKLM